MVQDETLRREASHTLQSTIRAVVVDLADIVQMTPAYVAAVKQQLKRYHPALEQWDDKAILQGLTSGTLAEGVHAYLGSSPEAPADSVEEQRCLKTLLESVGNRLMDTMEEHPMEYDQAAVQLLRELKTELRCLVGAVWQTSGARVLVRSLGLDDLFDAVVDKETQDAFGLRRQPAPDLLLKLCGDMAVSPFETVGIFSLPTGGVLAASTGTFGLVVGRPAQVEEIPLADQKKQMRKQGADVVVNSIREVDASMLNRWYECGIHEDAWNLVFTAYNAESELYRQTLTCVGNGYMGNRGAFEGCQACPAPQPGDHCARSMCVAGTFIAGVFNTAADTPNGSRAPQSVLVNVSNWCLVELRIGDGEFFNPLTEELLYYQHSLSFRDGLLERSITCRTVGDRETRIDVKRVLSMKQYHVGALQYTVTPLNYSASITLRSAIDGNSAPDHLEVVSAEAAGRDPGILLVSRTRESGIHIVTYVKHRLQAKTSLDDDGDDQLQFQETVCEGEGWVAEELTFSASSKRSYTLDKVVSVFTSRDLASPKDGPPLEGKAVARLEQLATKEIRHVHRFKQVYDPSRLVWAELWDKADVTIEGDRLAQKIARLNTYHLLIAASPHRDGIDAGLPIKGLAGDGCGHVMWDELFQFPFYLMRFPSVCKTHLLYRYNRLPEAKANATRAGFQGALFPWHSTDTGKEVSRPQNWIGPGRDWESYSRCYHVNHAIFYNCWTFFQETNATDFLESYLLEMMLEIAMFWQSVAELSELDGRYHIRGVVGPNAFHRNGAVGVTDNAYTNVMAVWCLGKLLELLETVQPQVRATTCAKVGMTLDVLQRVRDIHAKMCVHFNDEGVVEQFQGYDQLPRLDFDQYTHQQLANLKEVLQAEGSSPESYAVDKLPDTLLLFYLLSPREVRDLLVRLGYDVPENETEYLRKTFAYYCQRTLHSAALSFTILVKVGQLCWKTDYVWDWFMEAVKTDLYDREGTTHLGVHCAHMAATLDIVLSSFVGLKYFDDAILIEPNLPPTWTKVRFRRLLNGSWYSIIVTKKKVKLTLESTELSCATQRPVSIGGNKLLLCPWSSVGVKYHKMSTLREFFDLMNKTKFVRQSIVNALMSEAVTPAIQNQIQTLRHALEALEKVPFTEQGSAQLGLDARKRINLDLSYEIMELRKDICFLEEGAETLYNKFMRPTIDDFDELVRRGVEFLGGEHCSFQNLITDRDGTINNYCGRYKSSIQSAYNSVFLSCFALFCCVNAAILTAAPLQDMIDVSVNPDNVLVYAASKGREFLDMYGHYQTAPMDAAQKALLKRVNARLKQLVENPQYEKFALIGSGLQFKFGQSTVSRQDVSGSIAPSESQEFLKVVQQLCREVSPEDGLVIHDTGLDIEILPRLNAASQAESATFHKGKGLEFLNDRLQLDVHSGPNLVCGDTSSDVPMVEAAMALCPDRTYAIFVTKDKQLIGRVHSICPRTFIVPSPDVLVAIMHECARFKDTRHRGRIRGSDEGLHSFSRSRSDSLLREGVLRATSPMHKSSDAGQTPPHLP